MKTFIIWLIVVIAFAASGFGAEALVSKAPIRSIVPKAANAPLKALHPAPGAGALAMMGGAAMVAAMASPNAAPTDHPDWMPDFASEATKEVTASARWSSFASSISAQDIVLIPAGVTVTYDASSGMPVNAIVVKGNLAFDPARPTKLVVGTILVSGGTLSIKPNAEETAEITFHGSVSLASDPGQILLGLVSTGGTVDIEGRPVAEPFVHAIGAQGQSSITTDSAVDWKVGDEIFIGSSGPSDADPTYWWFNAVDVAQRMPFPEQWEEAHVTAASGDTVYIDKPLAYDHDSYAADMARSVMIDSDPANPGGARGHVMLAGPTNAVVEYARFYDLGRTSVAPVDDTVFTDQGIATHVGTNVRGRYALHAHHLSLPFIFKGDVVDGREVDRTFLDSSSVERAIDGSPKWGIVDHDSYGTVADDVVIGAFGAGIVGEDGTEVGSIDHDLVIGTGGGSGQTDDDRFSSSQGTDIGSGGFGYWFRGPFLNVTDDVATGHFNQAGFLYFVHPQYARNYLSSASWLPADLRGLAHADLMSREPIREFSGDTADGFFGNSAFMIFYSETPDTISDFTAHILGKGSTDGVVGRHIDQLTVSDSTIMGIGGTGQALVSSPDPGTVTASDTHASGFAQ